MVEVTGSPYPALVMHGVGYQAPDVMMLQLNLERYQKRLDRQRGQMKRKKEKAERLRADLDRVKGRLAQLKEARQQGGELNREVVDAEKRVSSSTRTWQIAQRQVREESRVHASALSWVEEEV